MNNIVKRIWVALAILIVLAAILSSIFRSLTPWAKQYKGDVEQHLSILIGQPVTIQTMETGWYWFQPVLKLKQVTINEGQDKSLHLEKMLVGIDLFKSLWKWQIQPGVLYVDDIHLNLLEKGGQWQVDGLSTAGLDSGKMTPERTKQALAWLAGQERLIVKHVSVKLQFSDGRVVPIKGIDISAVNSGGHYKLKGAAQLEALNSTAFQLIGDVYFNPYHLEQTKGEIYFSAKQWVPSLLKEIFPQMTQNLEGGKGDVALWVDLKKGTLSSVQAQLKLVNFLWHLPNAKTKTKLETLEANLAWKPTDMGWQLSADHVHLQLGDVKWPENKLSIAFDKTQQSYQVFAQSILIESLLAIPYQWPASLMQVISFKPHGRLTNSQFNVKDNQLNRFLTRFDQLGWQAKDKIPRVANLSGVLNWQPAEGHLELDSEQVLVGAKDYPTQNLDLLNGAVEWKELSDGLRISMERLVISKPDLTLSAEGVVDQASYGSLGHVRLSADFSGKNLQQWLPYIPDIPQKKKLNFWLKNDIKRLGEATGKININGMAKDFPFDDNNGEFTVVSHASGGELLITPKWQLIKDMEAYIRVKNRNLDVDLINADVQGVSVKQVHLRIDDIGKNKETLLIHGLAEGKAQKALNFIMASPLRNKLTLLQMLAMKGTLALNLRIEAALYPESDEILAQGDLQLHNNTVLIKHQLAEIKLEKLTGQLSFDEKGVHQSTLTATAFDYPFNMTIQSQHPNTTVLVNGECTIDSLKARYNWPILSILKGLLSVNASLKLSDSPDALDELLINSNLEGVAVDLPKPLGKEFSAKAPLAIKLNFNNKEGVRFKANYNDKLSSDILFQTAEEGGYDIRSGQIRLGGSDALDQNKPGVAIVGQLDGFPLQDWYTVLKKLAAEPSKQDLLHYLRVIHVKFAQLTFLKQQFDWLEVTAKRMKNLDWTFSLDHKNVTADVTFQPSTNKLSGYIKHLKLASMKKENDKVQLSSDIHPNQIPNLNLRIDDLTVGEVDVGNITIKSQSSSEQWLIEYLRIESPVYQMNVQGNWKQQGKNNKTTVQVKLHVNDLAKSLARWAITPAVNADIGDLEFSGGWQNTFFDFSLPTLSGKMMLNLQNGRITDLSRETEEKLGLGKLLSILSLQTIPRRLKLDFSDLSHQGYSFDLFKGNFKVSRGIISTQDSYLDGPVAYASMKGDLDLVKHMYDLNLSISPHITASLPVVATIAGGPIAGVAAWIANKIINKSMQKITTYSYKVSGPWQQPVVQQLSMVKQPIQKK